MRISDWSSDVCSSDLRVILALGRDLERLFRRARVFLPHLFFRAGEVGLSRRDVPAALRWFQRRAGFGLDLLEILVVLRAHRHIADVDAVSGLLTPWEEVEAVFRRGQLHLPAPDRTSTRLNSS